VVLPAAVHVDAGRSVHRAVGSGMRAGAPGPRVVPMPLSERARPISGTAARRAPGPDAAALAEATIDPELAASRARRDDEDTTPGRYAARRRNTLVVVGLLCAMVAAAGWLVPGLTATEPAAAAVAPSAGPAARPNPGQPPPTVLTPSVPLSAVVAAKAADPAEVPTTARLAPATPPPTGPGNRARRARLERAAVGGERAASSRAGTDTANAFAPVAAADDWQAEAGEAVAASAATAAPASAGDEPATLDSVLTDDVMEVPQLAAPAPKTTAADDRQVPPRGLSTAAAKTSPPPKAGDGRLVIEDLQVRGSLPESVVRRGIERVRASFERCYRNAGASGGRAGLGPVGVSFELDELGRVRAARASGSSVASLDRCVAEATRNVISRRAPDTGTVRGSFQLVVER
jgi:hypothetical protein